MYKEKSKLWKAASLLSVISLSVSLTFLPSCNKCPQDDNATNIFDSGLYFELRNKTTDENLLNLFYGAYNQDTIKILKEDLSKEPSLSIDASGAAWFKCLEYPKDLQGLNGKISKTFYLYLNQFDSDTIRVEFSLKSSDCPEPDFKDVNVFFNNTLNTTGTNPGSSNRIRYQIFKKSI